jgi:sulfatase maturation enzyme AslB (radical SAM superfamily)
VERSRTKCCSRCHLANYCSLECQVDNWAIHKKFCQQNYQLSILDGYI